MVAMRGTRALACAAAAFILAALAAGCGDDADSEPTSTPEATETAVEALPRPTSGSAITYVIDDVVWMADEGSDPVSLFSIFACPKQRWLTWSPDGETLLCHSNSTRNITVWSGADGTVLGFLPVGNIDPSIPRWSPTSDAIAVTSDQLILADATGEVIEQEPGLATAPPGAWASDGSRLAYWSERSDDVLIVTSDGVRRSGVGIVGRPLAWVLGDSALLLAENYEESDIGPPTYDTVIVDLETRARTPIALGPQFWLSSDARVAATLAEGGGLEIVDLRSGERRPIEGSSINFPGHQIPQPNVQFSPDGATLFWVDVDIEPTTVNSADVETGEMALVSSIDGAVFAAVSPDGSRIAYATYDTATQTNSVYVANADGSGEVFLGADGDGTMLNWAWRPGPGN